MTSPKSLNTFLRPKSVAVIGATERPGSWGSFIMGGLLSRPFAGPIYPVNNQVGQVFGVPAFNKIGDVPGPVELAVLTIPEAGVEQIVKECGEKGVQGIIIVSAGFGEAVADGKQREVDLVGLARSYGIRLLGPNVSGNFNLYSDFNASAAPGEFMIKTPIAAVCQGSYAIYDLLAQGYSRNMGVGQFVHTGNESDLTTTDFLECIGADPQIRGIIMYVEAIKDGRRFAEVARKASQTKPVIIYKAGKTSDASRAAQSHTGSLAGVYPVYEGLFRQTNLINCPTMELLLPLGHALVERPAMRGNRVAIITMGGSWGVSLSDALEAEGLCVPLLSPGLQKKLRELGMPIRASVKNPVDIGASGLFTEVNILKDMGREILISGEADALIVHGIGRPGMHSESTPEAMRFFLEINKDILREYAQMEKTFKIPVIIGSVYSPWESQLVHDLQKEGIRNYDHLEDIARILSRLARYWRRKEV